MIDDYLTDHGIPLDLSGYDAGADETTRRDVLSLPFQLADQHGQRVLLAIDELQRVVDCEDHEPLISDLVDLYAGDRRVSVLVSGSDDRGLELLADGPLGKLVERYGIEPRIPARTWRPALVDRFALAGLTIDQRHIETILEFGRERPYETMLAAYHTADNGLAQHRRHGR